jgi:hypothetical protein
MLLLIRCSGVDEVRKTLTPHHRGVSSVQWIQWHTFRSPQVLQEYPFVWFWMWMNGSVPWTNENLNIPIMAVRILHNERLWAEYTKPGWANQRLRLYGGKKSSFAKFFNELDTLRLDKLRRPVMAFGAGKAVARKGCTAAPSTRAFKECQQRMVTIPIEEFRTTYTHCRLGCKLSKVQKRNRPRSRMHTLIFGPETTQSRRRRSTVRGLLWCRSTSKAREHYLNRDFNAAVNIRRYLVPPERPKELCRSNFVGRPLARAIGQTLRRWKIIDGQENVCRNSASNWKVTL